MSSDREYLGDIKYLFSLLIRLVVIEEIHTWLYVYCGNYLFKLVHAYLSTLASLISMSTRLLFQAQFSRPHAA